ncbi:hypothetical protein V8E36_008617 [Tilletia maclaganii]
MMFGAPPPPSPQKLAAAKLEARQTLKNTAVAASLLFVAPHIIKFVGDLLS